MPWCSLMSMGTPPFNFKIEVLIIMINIQWTKFERKSISEKLP